MPIKKLDSLHFTLRFVCLGDGTYSAITAVLAANGVLVAYIIMSVIDDKQASASPSQPIKKDASESKKER